MIAELASLANLSQGALWVGFAVFVRLGAIMAVLPVFGDQFIPVRVRLALTLMFTFIVAPAIAPSIGPRPETLIAAVRLLGPEIISGLFFGLVLRFFVLALQLAGAIAAQSTSLSQIFGGTAGVDPQPAIGHFLVVGAAALAAIAGLHVKAAAYMIQSYAIVPFGQLLLPAVMAQAGTQEVTRSFSLGFSLAAPFLIASFIYNLVLGVINRAMPQLMVSFVGAPAITAGGLFLFLLTAPLMLSVWLVAFDSFMAAPFQAMP